jgi:hypothetical protein
MGYKITSNYRWYLIPKEPTILVKVYYIEGIPFDFDQIEDADRNNNLKAIQEADSNIGVKAEDIFKKSDYLIAEMMHPLLFELELANPEEMPTE